MRRSFFILVITLTGALSIYTGCRQDKVIIDLEGSRYPEAVGKIILTECAVAGCHNTQSKDAAAGLDLSSWETMMQGDRNGAVVIPYSHEFSPLFLFTNTYADLGVQAEPTMPYQRDPLSHEEVITLRDWIDAGAP
ncbi:MAG TPA: c-type cytochrome domain-containing protein, partial [Bacteroidia bacterium]|nr:c-type cytochrome domain-containing protein [Bacteroidia bacterium]